MSDTSLPAASDDPGGPGRPRTPPASPKGALATVSYTDNGVSWSMPTAAPNGAYLFVCSSNTDFIAWVAGKNASSINRWQEPTPTTAKIGGLTFDIGTLIDPAQILIPTGLAWTYIALPALTPLNIQIDPKVHLPGDLQFWCAAATESA